tara:strand:+ start:215 stop:316 length:102 start_codon:yes stop_codon:yes gene_type:complete
MKRNIKKLNALPLTSITPTRYNISVKSIFGMNQ